MIRLRSPIFFFLTVVLIVFASSGFAKEIKGHLRGMVVTNECAASIKNVRVSVSFKGKQRRNITKTDDNGYFEIDMVQLYPDWKPGSNITISFNKKGYIKKHKNIRHISEQLEDIPLNAADQHETEASRFSDYKRYRNNDCNSWTVFAMPHKTKQDLEFPDDGYAIEMHLRLSTYFQELDLPLEKIPNVNLEWLADAKDLGLSGNDAGDFGTYLNALGVLYGNVKAGKDGNGAVTSRVSSYMHIVSSFENKFSITKIAHRVPYDHLDEDIYEENSDYIKALMRTSLFAVVSRELDRISSLSSRPDNYERLQRIRDVIIADRKNFPKKADQSRVERSNFHVLNQLAKLVDEAILDTQK